jgi:glycerol-3-phosphate dehydrogenase
MVKFSVLDRPIFLNKLSNEKFDLLIIGGGITGAGIALDAASRGLKTALIEKNDFAFGTSSRSTKLIHGGLRYLKQLEFGLVKEVGSERAIVHRLAPHLVIPEKMLLPLSEKRGLGYWLTSIGLRIYDYLAGVKPEDQRRMLTRNQTFKYEPMLKADDIKGGAIYAEYRTDDARLTIEILKTAFRHGATILNYLKAKDFIYSNDRVSGVVAKDELTGDEINISAAAVVSAAGPWVDEVREINNSKKGKRLHLTKGVHIVVPREKVPVQQSIYFDVDDGRMIFAIPRGRATYIGTTDTNYNGSIDEVGATREDAEYLIKAVNATFPDVKLTLNEEGKSASQLSRKDEIFESDTGLISIAGGKLTGYRKMAERIVNLVLKRHFPDRKSLPCKTAKIALTGSSFETNKDVNKYISSIEKRISAHGFSRLTAEYLVSTYGIQTDAVIQLFENMVDKASAEVQLLKAETLFSVNHEMAVKLADIFIRRTGLLYFDISKIDRNLEAIAAYMKGLLHWTDEQLKIEIEQIRTAIQKIKAFS